MIGRLDLLPVICRVCQGSKVDPKKRKRPCPRCNGAGTEMVCRNCCGYYPDECVDTALDQSYCEHPKVPMSKRL